MNRYTKQQAGRKGGRATLAKHGRDHFATIGRQGAKVLHERYNLTPYGIGDFALVDKQTGQIRAFLSGVKP